jgi:hypothetical protein
MNAMDRAKVMTPWLDALEDLSVVTSACDKGALTTCWSTLLDLLVKAPIVLSELGISLETLPVAARMAAHDAWESAVLALRTADVGYLISQGRNGLCLATVVLPASNEEVTAEGKTPALALIGALAAAIIESRLRLTAYNRSNIGSLILPNLGWLNDHLLH